MPERRDLSGIVHSGRGLAVSRMADREVMQKVQELAGFPVVPATLNVRLPAPLERGPSWRFVPAGDIAPHWEERTGQAGYFVAAVTVADRHRGLAFQALEPGESEYPRDQLELFCEVHLRDLLGLRDGDPVAVRLNSSGSASPS
jgi:CTP-dependent riboflavin kinase